MLIVHSESNTASEVGVIPTSTYFPSVGIILVIFTLIPAKTALVVAEYKSLMALMNQKLCMLLCFQSNDYFPV